MAKQQLTSAKVLTHYTPTLPISMAADASAYGIRAVIAHVFPNGNEHPVAFASRTLTSSESKYSQIEEALLLVFGVRRFHQHLYGRSFTLVTDDKPLLAILGPKKGIPSIAAARMQHWAWILSTYHYDIESGQRISMPTPKGCPDCHYLGFPYTGKLSPGSTRGSQNL